MVWVYVCLSLATKAFRVGVFRSHQNELRC
jgi:hypothetical protein